MKNILTILLFCLSISANCQYFKIQDMGVLKNNISLDTLKIDKKKLTFFIFYKENSQKKNCEKSLIHNVGGCNYETFKEKLNILLLKGSFIQNTTLKVYKVPNDQNYYFVNRDNKKAPIADLTAIIFGYDSEIYNENVEFDKVLSLLNKVSTYSVNSQNNMKTNSIFEFESKIRVKGTSDLNLPKNIWALTRNKENQDVSCPALDIPEDDMFLEHLTMLFRPNFIINWTTEILNQIQYENIDKIDSLKQIVENHKNEIEKIKYQKFSNDNMVMLTSSYSLFTIGSSSNDLSSNLKTGFLNVFGLSYSRTFTSGLGLVIGFNNLNAMGTLNTTELEVEHQEVLPSSTVLMNKKTNIINLTENWNLDNAIGLNLGFTFKKTIGKKVNLFMDIELGKILNSNVRTTLQEGVFNYRASIPGIEDEIFNIASLDLKENVTYSEKFNQKFGFTGSSFSICSDVEYSFYKNFFFQGGFQFEYYRLKNTDFNSESKVSTSLGDFNSSFNNVKSITLLPFSIGLGVGIKF